MTSEPQLYPSRESAARNTRPRIHQTNIQNRGDDWGTRVEIQEKLPLTDTFFGTAAFYRTRAFLLTDGH
jgi:hypothetical protein